MAVGPWIGIAQDTDIWRQKKVGKNLYEFCLKLALGLRLPSKKTFELLEGLKRIRLFCQEKKHAYKTALKLERKMGTKLTKDERDQVLRSTISGLRDTFSKMDNKDER